jgi:hypothetical protein
VHPAVLLILALSLAQVAPTVTVTTDRAWYAPGEQVQVIVHIDDGTLSGMIWFYVDKPDGHNLYFAYENVTLAHATGLVFTLPQDAPEGNYTVTVTQDHSIYVQTTFIVAGQPIPEFPFTFVVFFFAFTVATLAISRRKTGACTETAAIDS